MCSHIVTTKLHAIAQFVVQQTQPISQPVCLGIRRMAQYTRSNNSHVPQKCTVHSYTVGLCGSCSIAWGQWEAHVQHTI